MLTPEIQDARRGRITASQAARMMTGWDAAPPAGDYPPELYDWIVRHGKPKVGDVKDVLPCEVSGALVNAAWAAYQFAKPSQGLLTYAKELACAELFEHDPMTEVSTRAMEFGIEREPEAVEKLIEATGLPFVKTGEDQIHISVDGVGATPDGVVYDDLDLIVTGAEIKARTPMIHADQLFIIDNASLLELDFGRFSQMQVSMHVCGCDEWYCASYNPHAIRPEHRFHYCIIKRDDAFLRVFRQRAALVFKHKAEFLDRLHSIRSNDQQDQAA